jgi:hypothetical protein
MDVLAFIRARIEALETLVHAALRRSLATPTILHGQVILSSGVSGDVSAPGLRSTSSIVLTKRIQSADATTVEYVALEADRSFGLAGRFKATAITSAGAVQNADDSTLDYVVII